jgi:Flp pilus assembly protein TadG
MRIFAKAVLNRSYRRLSRNSEGASAIEFAIVAPFLLMLVLGMLSFGLYIGTAHGVAQLAADAARASIAGLTDPERESIAVRHVTETADSYTLLESGHVAVQAAPDPADPTQFVVAVTYDASDLPIWVFSGLLPLPNRNIVRTATIKRGGY